MGEIKTSRKGIDYITCILQDKVKVVSKATLTKIEHNTKENEICLKLGRYNKVIDEYGNHFEEIENKQPKSELTLTNEEFLNLIQFIQVNYAPLKSGIKKFISLDDSFSPENAAYLKELFNQPDKQEIVKLIIEKDILPEEIILGIEYANRLKAIEEFKSMLDKNLVENEWQKWFKANDWVLGSEFVKILDERHIDTKNIADFLMEAYDGFLDIIEIKRPHKDLPFWAANKDHDNYYPSIELVKAITQATNYIYEVERESNSDKFIKRMGGVRTIKPRSTLIYGRSNDWNDEQRESYRILNSSYHNLNIMTYDHVLERAERILALHDKLWKDNTNDISEKTDDLPF